MGKVYNQQPAPFEDIALTPRLETHKDDVWYTNLFDLTATFNSSDSEEKIDLVAKVQLENEAREVVENTASDFEFTYTCSQDMMRINFKTTQPIKEPTVFVLPMISPTGEEVQQPKPNEINIQKPEGLVSVKASVPLKIKEIPRSRTFNMVPGAEAVPILAYFEENGQEVEISIEVS